MKVQKLLERITLDPNVMTREDIIACLQFASESLGNTTFMPLTAEAYLKCPERCQTLLTSVGSSVSRFFKFMSQISFRTLHLYD
jgi:hypothetical protein